MEVCQFKCVGGFATRALRSHRIHRYMCLRTVSCVDFQRPYLFRGTIRSQSRSTIIFILPAVVVSTRTGRSRQTRGSGIYVHVNMHAGYVTCTCTYRCHRSLCDQDTSCANAQLAVLLLPSIRVHAGHWLIYAGG